MERDLRYCATLWLALLCSGCSAGSSPTLLSGVDIVPPDARVDAHDVTSPPIGTPVDAMDAAIDAALDRPPSPVDAPRAADASPVTDTPRSPDASPVTDTPRSPDAPAPLDAPRVIDAPAPLDVPRVVDAPAAVDVPRVIDVAPVDTGPQLNANDLVPALDAAALAHLHAVRALGVTMGMRPNVFAKIGDSITESASFLSDIGYGWYDLGAYVWLEPTVAFFRAYHFTTEGNSFNRSSLCAMGGWIASYALAHDPDSALRHELGETRPAYALLMYGTNDMDYVSVTSFSATMNRIVDVIEGNGTVAVISTIPDRLDSPADGAMVPTFNQAIRDLASTRHLPLMEYWGAMRALPNRGVDTDGIHPSVYVTSSPICGVLTTEGLRHGYNLRNLIALVALDRLRNTP